MQVSNILRSGRITEASLKGKIEITRIDSDSGSEEDSDEEEKEDEEAKKD